MKRKKAGASYCAYIAGVSFLQSFFLPKKKKAFGWLKGDKKKAGGRKTACLR